MRLARFYPSKYRIAPAALATTNVAEIQITAMMTRTRWSLPRCLSRRVCLPYNLARTRLVGKIIAVRIRNDGHSVPHVAVDDVV